MSDSNILNQSDEDFDVSNIPEDPTTPNEDELTNNGDEATKAEVEIEENEQNTLKLSLEEETEDLQDPAVDEEKLAEGIAKETSEEIEQNVITQDLIENKEEEEKEEESVNETITKIDWTEISKPFKANGKTMEVTSVEDARTLMQLGANYTKKMKALQPNLKLLKMLENNSLLDENRLTYLIDLDKKDPEAINKLVKDSGMDPLNIDLDTESTYTPSDYTVNDAEVLMDQVLEDIQNTDQFKQTYDIAVNKWDDKSREVLANNPEMLRGLNNEVGSGYFDQITQIVDHEQALGRLSNMSDLDAYNFVGNKLTEAGAFDNKPTPATQSVQPVVDNTKKTNQVDETKRNAQRKSASSTSSLTKEQAPTNEFNPLSMTDDEFEAAFNKAMY